MKITCQKHSIDVRYNNYSLEQHTLLATSFLLARLCGFRTAYFVWQMPNTHIKGLKKKKKRKEKELQSWEVGQTKFVALLYTLLVWLLEWQCGFVGTPVSSGLKYLIIETMACHEILYIHPAWMKPDALASFCVIIRFLGSKMSRLPIKNLIFFLALFPELSQKYIYSFYYGYAIFEAWKIAVFLKG